MLFRLGHNIGYQIDGVVARKLEPGFADAQKEAWDLVRNSIDNGIPCYGWELEIPEFYVVFGYDDIGYFYSGAGCDLGKGPKPWQELGNTGIGLIEIYRVKPGQAVDDTSAVKEALEFTLEHAKSPAKWIYPNYRSGLAGYDIWIDTVENGTATGNGLAYNAALWAECRGYGTQFLREAKERLNGNVSTLLEEAAQRYDMVHQHLEKVSSLFPFPPGSEITDEERCNNAVNYLKNARMEEEAGLKLLNMIVKAL